MMADSNSNKYLISTIIIGFVLALMGGCISENLTPPPGNAPPVIIGMIYLPDSTIVQEDTVWISCMAEDEEGDTLVYKWSHGDGGLLESTGMRVRWWAGGTVGDHPIRVIVSDSTGSDSLDFHISVVEKGTINYPPRISNLSVSSFCGHTLRHCGYLGRYYR